MKELLKYIIEGITGSSDFKIEEVEDDGKTTLEVYANPEIIGLIIGKNGKTIKSIRNIIKVRSTLEEKLVFIDVKEKED
jgi:predicted RNA-binding protein YlqC (UPF0109 family)